MPKSKTKTPLAIAIALGVLLISYWLGIFYIAAGLVVFCAWLAGLRYLITKPDQTMTLEEKTARFIDEIINKTQEGVLKWRSSMYSEDYFCDLVFETALMDGRKCFVWQSSSANETRYYFLVENSVLSCGKKCQEIFEAARDSAQDFN